MTWSPPTVNDFKNRFPVFAEYDDDLVQSILEESIAEVTDTWVQKDRTPAVLHLTAHRLSSTGAPGGGVGGVSEPVPTGAVVKSRTVGGTRMEFEYGDKAMAAAAAQAEASATPYLDEFKRLARRNFPAVVTVI